MKKAAFIVLYVLVTSVLAAAQLDTSDKSRVKAAVSQALEEKGLTIESEDEAGATFKSSPFKFAVKNGTQYKSAYQIDVLSGMIKVHLTDLHSAGGQKPAMHEQNDQTVPLEGYIGHLLREANLAAAAKAQSDAEAAAAAEQQKAAAAAAAKKSQGKVALTPKEVKPAMKPALPAKTNREVKPAFVFMTVPVASPKTAPTDKPSETPGETPGDKPVDKPQETPSDPTAEKPNDAPAEKTNQTTPPKPSNVITTGVISTSERVSCNDPLLLQMSSESTARHEELPVSVTVDELNLNMTPEEVRHKILLNHPGAKAYPLKSAIGTEYYSEEMVYGEYYVIEPFKEYRDTSSARAHTKDYVAGALDGEVIEVLHLPGAKDLLGIYRFKGYADGHYPAQQTVRQGLDAKYGKPWTAGIKSNGTDSVWHWNYVPLKNGLNLPGCTEDLESDQILWQSAEPKMSPTSVAQLGGTAFAQFVNYTGENTKRFAHCGQYLRVDVQDAANTDYVRYYEQWLFDFDRARAEYDAFATEYNKKQLEARDRRMRQGGASEPTF